MKIIKKISVVILVVCIATLSCIALASCKYKDEYYVKKETKFAISAGTKIMDIPISPLLSTDNSGITLRPDGTMTMSFVFSSAVSYILNESINIATMLGDLDLSEFMDSYLNPLFPGFTIDDVPSSMKIIETTLGMRLVGLDYDSPDIAALLDGLKTGVFPDNITIPTNIGLEYNGPYALKDMVDDTGKTYTVLYMGKHEEKGESYMFMELQKEDSGKNSLHSRVEFINFSLVAKEV